LFAVGGFAEAVVAVVTVVALLCFVAAAAIVEADWQFVVVSALGEGHSRATTVTTATTASAKPPTANKHGCTHPTATAADGCWSPCSTSSSTVAQSTADTGYTWPADSSPVAAWNAVTA
jgi:hypothetical protein